MKRRVLAVALIFLLMLGGCKNQPAEEQAFTDAVVQDPAPREQPSVPQEGASSVEEQPPEQEPSAEMTEEPTEEPKEEQKEEDAPAVPMTVQQVAPLKGRIHTLSAEDQKVLEVLFERQEWGAVNQLYQVHEFEITVGEQNYWGYFGHQALNAGDSGTRLNNEDRQTLLQILEKYIGVYEGVPTVEQLNSDAPRRVMSQEDWLTAKSIWSHASEEETWGPTPSAFQAEFLLLLDTFGYYYDSTQGMISIGNSAKPLAAEEQAALEQMLSKYIKSAG